MEVHCWYRRDCIIVRCNGVVLALLPLLIEEVARMSDDTRGFVVMLLRSRVKVAAVMLSLVVTLFDYRKWKSYRTKESESLLKYK